MEMGNASSSDNEDQVQEILPPQKSPSGVLKFKCLHCSLAFATLKEYMLHSEMHAHQMQNNPSTCKRTVSQRDMALHNNTNVPNTVQLPQPTTTAVGSPNVVMNQPSLNLTLAPPSKTLSLALTLGTDASVVPPPPGFPNRHLLHHREVDTLQYVKRPRNDYAQVDEKMDVGGTSGAGGSSSSNGGYNGGSGGGSNSSSGGFMKPLALFDLNLFPPEE